MRWKPGAVHPPRRRSQAREEGPRATTRYTRPRARSLHQPSAQTISEDDAERERAVEVRPERDERHGRDERAGAPRTPAPEQNDQEREAGEAEELRALRPDEAREEDRRERGEHRRERPVAPRLERGEDDERDEGADRERAERDDALPRAGEPGAVEEELPEPLVARERRARGRPGERVAAREAAREEVARGRELPEHVAVAHGEAGREEREHAPDEERERERAARRRAAAPRPGEPRRLAPVSRSGERSRPRQQHEAAPLASVHQALVAQHLDERALRPEQHEPDVALNERRAEARAQTHRALELVEDARHVEGRAATVEEHGMLGRLADEEAAPVVLVQEVPSRGPERRERAGRVVGEVGRARGGERGRRDDGSRKHDCREHAERARDNGASAHTAERGGTAPATNGASTTHASGSCR